MTTADLPEPVAWMADDRFRAITARELMNVPEEKGRRESCKSLYPTALFTLDQFLAERQRAERAEAELDAATSDEAFETKYRAAYEANLNKPGYWEDLARILSHRLREMDKRSRAANRRADAAEQDLRIAQGNTDAAISDYNKALKRLKEAETIIEQQRKALQPLAESVFNDNGDMGASRYTPDFETFVAAYFAKRAATEFLGKTKP